MRDKRTPKDVCGEATIAVTHRWVRSGFWSLSCLRHPAEQSLLLSSWMKRRNGGSAMQRILEQAKERFGWQGGLRLHGDKLKLTWLGGEKLEPGLAVNALAVFFPLVPITLCVSNLYTPERFRQKSTYILQLIIFYWNINKVQSMNFHYVELKFNWNWIGTLRIVYYKTGAMLESKEPNGTRQTKRADNLKW